MCSWGACVVNGMDSWCILCLARVTGWLGCFSGGGGGGGGGGALHIIVKKTCFLVYTCTYLCICHVDVLRVILCNVYAVKRLIVSIHNNESVF